MHERLPMNAMIRRPAAPLLLLAALAGCGKGDAAPAAGEGGGFAMPVEVSAAFRDTVVDAIGATGQIEPFQSTELRPDIDGRLVEIYAREGQMVARGDALFKVDDAELKAQVARLEAERDLAEQALTRTRSLLEQKAASQADLEQAQAAARSARAQLELTQVRLSRTVVRAPFAGIAGQRFASLGDYVTSSTPLIMLQTVNPQRAVLRVPERYAGQLKVGQTVRFTVAALPAREFTGRVDFVDPVVQLPARTILVKAVVPNPGRSLQAGMFIEARLATDVRPDAVVVPEEAILPVRGANFVWVVDSGKAVRRQVGLGVRTPGFVEIRSGLDGGEQVVTGGLERLQDGMPVNAKPVDRRPVQRSEEAAGSQP